jgi:DNA-binding transcriptional LysR family regulator
VYQTCQHIFSSLSDLEMKIADLKGLRRGTLRLAVITSAKYVAPRLLGRFCEVYPGVQVSLKVTNRERLLDRIAGHMDDLYILGQPPEQLHVEAYPLIPNPLYVMADRNHPLVGAKNIPLERLLDEPFIMREPGSGTRAAVFRLFADAGLDTPMTKMEFASNESIKQAVVAGFGITVLSRHSLALEGTAGPIALLDVQKFPIERTWYVVHEKNKQLSVVAQAFLEFVKQESVQIAASFNAEMKESRGSGATKAGKRRQASA